MTGFWPLSRVLSPSARNQPGTKAEPPGTNSEPTRKQHGTNPVPPSWFRVGSAFGSALVQGWFRAGDGRTRANGQKPVGRGIADGDPATQVCPHDGDCGYREAVCVPIYTVYQKSGPTGPGRNICYFGVWGISGDPAHCITRTGSKSLARNRVLPVSLRRTSLDYPPSLGRTCFSEAKSSAKSSVLRPPVAVKVETKEENPLPAGEPLLSSDRLQRVQKLLEKRRTDDADRLLRIQTMAKHKRDAAVRDSIVRSGEDDVATISAAAAAYMKLNAEKSAATARAATCAHEELAETFIEESLLPVAGRMPWSMSGTGSQQPSSPSTPSMAFAVGLGITSESESELSDASTVAAVLTPAAATIFPPEDALLREQLLESQALMETFKRQSDAMVDSNRALCTELAEATSDVAALKAVNVPLVRVAEAMQARAEAAALCEATLSKTLANQEELAQSEAATVNTLTCELAEATATISSEQNTARLISVELHSEKAQLMHFKTMLSNTGTHEMASELEAAKSEIGSMNDDLHAIQSELMTYMRRCDPVGAYTREIAVLFAQGEVTAHEQAHLLSEFEETSAKRLKDENANDEQARNSNRECWFRRYVRGIIRKPCEARSRGGWANRRDLEHQSGPKPLNHHPCRARSAPC